MTGVHLTHGFRLWLALALSMLMVACSHHQPAPVEDQSSVYAKRRATANGSHRVVSGDTLYAIAFSYGMDFRVLARWNGISSPYTIYPGQEIRLSAPTVSQKDGSRDRSSAVQVTPLPSPGKTSTQTNNNTTTSSSASKKTVPPKKAEPDKPKDTSTTSVSRQSSTPSGNDPVKWRWPVTGRVLRGYVAGDPARNGVDIAGKEGQAILASAAGTGVYSGSGLIGYGKLIIVKHNQTYLSAYGLNREIRVAEGDRVSAGQIIALMGEGPGRKPVLHFEIRRNGKPVDPLRYLPGR